MKTFPVSILALMLSVNALGASLTAEQVAFLKPYLASGKLQGKVVGAGGIIGITYPGSIHFNLESGNRLVLESNVDLTGEKCGSKIGALQSAEIYPWIGRKEMKAVFAFDPGSCAYSKYSYNLQVLFMGKTVRTEFTRTRKAKKQRYAGTSVEESYTLGWFKR